MKNRLKNNKKGAVTILGFLLMSVLTSLSFADKLIIGRIENVKLNNTEFVIKAKIDTGARNSSLNATEYKLSQKNGEKWIKFEVTNDKGEIISFNKQIKRFTKIKRKGAEVQQRPVIEVDICLGTIKKRVEVNLVNRSHFNYQMLIGRSFLHNDFVVDVDQKFARKPDC